MRRQPKTIFIALVSITFHAVFFSHHCLAGFEPRVIKKHALVIATGLPGTGKSHYLKQIAKIVSNSIYLDKDVIAETFQGKHSNESDFYKNNVQKQSYELMLKIGEDNLSSNKVIILDSYFGNKLFTPLFKEFIHSKTELVAHQNGWTEKAKPYVIYFICDDAKKHHDRIVKRGALLRDADKMEPQKFEVYRRERLEEHEKTFKILTSAEYSHIPFLIIHTDDESPQANEENVQKILNFIEN